MDKLAGGLIVVLVMLAGVLLGWLTHAWWQQKQELNKRRIPKTWPLTVRTLVNSRERRTWLWLSRAFPEHALMVKIPVTRFTLPAVREEGLHWFQLLSGVYTTFTLCDTQGNVIGCVDVPGPQGLSLSNQTLKHTLLSQCNIRYWVVDPEHLPSINQIRAAFLGEHAILKEEEERLRHEAEFTQTKEHLQEALSRQRQHSSDFIRLESALHNGPLPGEHHDSQLSTTWRHDSFVAPLDSRSGDLR